MNLPHIRILHVIQLTTLPLLLYPGNKGMLATLLALYFYFPDLAKMHIYVLGFLVAGLMISVNW